MSKFLDVCKEWSIKPKFSELGIDLRGGDRQCREYLQNLLAKKENFISAVHELMAVDPDCKYIIFERAGIAECDTDTAILYYFK